MDDLSIDNTIGLFFPSAKYFFSFGEHSKVWVILKLFQRHARNHLNVILTSDVSFDILSWISKK